MNFHFKEEESLIHIGSSIEFMGYPNLKILDLEDASKLMMAYGFKPGSEFLALFNHQLQRLREAGILERALRTLNSQQPKGNVKEQPEALVLGFENLTFPFVVLAAGCLGAVTIAILEKSMRCNNHLYK